MKLNLLAGSAAMVLVCTLAHASEELSAPVLKAHSPVLSAMMKVEHARYGFETVRTARLILNSDPAADSMDPASMTLEYYREFPIFPGSGSRFQHQSVFLEITKTETDGCGSVHYSAHLPKVELEGDNASHNVGARFSVSLTDHRHRKCKDLKPYKWEAEVRQGFGWCGTGDATMSLKGNPRKVNGDLTELPEPGSEE